jgi:hypothetical protein
MNGEIVKRVRKQINFKKGEKHEKINCSLLGGSCHRVYGWY